MLLIAYPTYAVLTLLVHHRAVRRARLAPALPTVTAPFPLAHPLWTVIGRYLRPVCMALLPARWCTWVRIAKVGWPFEEGRRVHEDVWREKGEGQVDMAGSFLSVSVSGWEVVVCDEVAVMEVLKRRDVFIKPEELYGYLNVFGRNIDTINGDEWARHRKITAPCFNERVSALVWDESARQTRAMLAQWMSTAATTTTTTAHPISSAVTTMADDMRLVALHVLSAAGLGMRQDFATGMRSAPAPGSGHSMTYRDALMQVLQHIVLVMAAPEWLLLLPGAPAAWRGVVAAKREFRRYMEEMLDRERGRYRGKEQGGGDAFVKEVPNLMVTLIRSSDAARNKRERLSDEEIFGNLFFFNFAGHDTTANALAFALALLAVEPEMQEWVGEEVAMVFGERDVRDIKYEEVFPRLVRCQAVLNESMRLYGPVPYYPRRAASAQAIPLSTGASIPVPAGANIVLNSAAVHTSPAWSRGTGLPAREFHPKRWIKTDNGGEVLEQPENTTYLPWAFGPRTCLGLKFAQVEFVSVLSSVFRQHRLRPALEDDNPLVLSGLRQEESRLAEQRIREALASAGMEKHLLVALEEKEKVVFRLEKVA
ncbi:cytochrome P450 [Macrophomina phaseolina]|uniref:Cytochrome P450 n=1 Tax=Macrophomina phaseolina TaxID=35725 RepID=A0ABQ8GE33_9PEZI|nr:cytochrome P450 [Macrophomina phaseolina]